MYEEMQLLLQTVELVGALAVVYLVFLKNPCPRLMIVLAVVAAVAIKAVQGLFVYDGGAVVGREFMRAAVYAPELPQQYILDMVPVPSHTERSLLIKVGAAALNPSNYKMLPAQIPFLRHLREWVIGYDVAGTVVSVGAHPDCDVKVGDRVWGMTLGSVAEYAVLSCYESVGMGPIPAKLGFAEAAGLNVAGLTGVMAYERSGLKKGDSVLVIGASGGCGIFGVTIAAHAIGANVTGICSTRNVEMVRGLGAHQVINYKSPADMAGLKSGGQQFDVIYDTVTSFAPEDPDYEPDMRPLLKPGGRYVAIGPSPNPLDIVRATVDVFTSLVGLRVQRAGYDMFLLAPTRSRVRKINKMFDDGHLSQVPIDSTFVLEKDEDIMTAFDRMRSRRTTGKIVLTVAPPGAAFVP